jgi:hypothetical protein
MRHRHTVLGIAGERREVETRTAGTRGTLAGRIGLSGRVSLSATVWGGVGRRLGVKEHN